MLADVTLLFGRLSTTPYKAYAGFVVGTQDGSLHKAIKRRHTLLQLFLAMDVGAARVHRGGAYIDAPADHLTNIYNSIPRRWTERRMQCFQGLPIATL